MFRNAAESAILGLALRDAAVSAGRAEPTDSQAIVFSTANLLSARDADAGPNLKGDFYVPDF
jgi:hypothetical protein